ncbi:MAG: rRNA maturation RNase YbeY [Acidimicrobiaceae bacterium]|nr:rRNA maturation RNase YbeY [Acidimicrobiaceae bacterium]
MFYILAYNTRNTYLCTVKKITLQAQNQFSVQNEEQLLSWLSDCVLLLDKQIGDIHIALMDDDALLALNQKHLDHDHYTDVITFDYSTAKEVNCDIAVSTDRVLENATLEGVSVENELARVLIHGILHCVGYSDKTPNDKQIMRVKEDEMLKQFHVEHKSL